LARRAEAAPVVPLCQVPPQDAQAWPTGVSELDRVLGGGIVPGSAVLVGGEPGVGKSTLLLDVASRAAGRGRKVVYASGEESLSQVARRAERIGADHPALKLCQANDLGQLLAMAAQERPDLLVVDSIQTLGCDPVNGAAGGVAVVRAVTAELVAAAKTGRMACLLVGHVTKDGTVAGPRTIEHLVDAVLVFEGDQQSALRWLRSTKNRFGSSDEVGCFQMEEDGIKPVTDPGGMFLEDTESPAPGVCAGIMLDGRRPLAVAVQALVTSVTKNSKPVRATNGLDPRRLAAVLAVLQAHANIGLRAKDVYTATGGGIRCHDPALDLPLALACAAARFEQVIPGQTAALGEIALGGQIRGVRGLSRRLAEAERLGLRRVLVPHNSQAVQLAVRPGLQVVPVATIHQALSLVLPEPAVSRCAL
jgi:DNA repair protein RadA/Sms